ncbi:farnesyltransferase subunit beta-like protein [Drosera capensis]
MLFTPFQGFHPTTQIPYSTPASREWSQPILTISLSKGHIKGSYRRMKPSSSNLTVTQREQCMVESQVFGIYKHFSDLPPSAQNVMLELARDRHIEYLTNGLRQLGSSFCVLDANRPWLCYWILHSLALLGEPVDEELENNAVDFLNRCQMPHLATTYAAVNSLVTLGGHNSLPSIDRRKVYNFLKRMKDPAGGFRFSVSAGDLFSFTFPFVCDIHVCLMSWFDLLEEFKAVICLNVTICSRTLASIMPGNLVFDFCGEPKTFCPSGCMNAGKWMLEPATLPYRILNILDNELVENVGNYILSCQTYEGGIAGEPGSEAHGGYTFCGLATMILINEVQRLDIAGLVNWVAFRQGVECGFQGRTNKLVDGCYSFWQGGVSALIQRLKIDTFTNLVGSNHSVGCVEPSLDSSSSEEQRDHQDDSSLLDQSHNFRGRDELADGETNACDSRKLAAVGVEFIEQHTQVGPLFHSLGLQQYLLLCSQVFEGGFRDKPGKPRDHYHTCYCLSGLSVCQYSWSKDAYSSPLPQALFGPFSNLLESIHPLYNVMTDRLLLNGKGNQQAPTVK